MVRAPQDTYKNTLPIPFTLHDPPIAKPQGEKPTCAGQMNENQFNLVIHSYLSEIKGNRRMKALINVKLAVEIRKALHGQKIGDANFRHWARSRFRVIQGTTGDLTDGMQGQVLQAWETKNKKWLTVAYTENLYDIMTMAHQLLGHRGRDAMVDLVSLELLLLAPLVEFCAAY